MFAVMVSLLWEYIHPWYETASFEDLVLIGGLCVTGLGFVGVSSINWNYRHHSKSTQPTPMTIQEFLKRGKMAGQEK